mmetsp:Transcript_43755/g.93684  ORF Transcript_43755/g.93684 Transcript_43755/m.93684 type:complete len:304 (-) Transcript_43755:102-1013(-)
MDAPLHHVPTPADLGTSITNMTVDNVALTASAEARELLLERPLRLSRPGWKPDRPLTSSQTASSSSSSPAPSSPSFVALLSDEGVSLILAFVIPELSSMYAVAAVDRRFHSVAGSSAAFSGATIVLSHRLLEKHSEALLRRGCKSWGSAKEVRFAPGYGRRVVQDCLQRALPTLHCSVNALGPLMMFIMWADIVPDQVIDLNLFEPRYRWFCRRLLEQPVEQPKQFGFVTHGFLKSARCGARGYLCDVRRIRPVNGGSGDYTCRLIVGPPCQVVEAWTEKVPGEPEAAELQVGYLELAEHYCN